MSGPNWHYYNNSIVRHGGGGGAIVPYSGSRAIVPYSGSRAIVPYTPPVQRATGKPRAAAAPSVSPAAAGAAATGLSAARMGVIAGGGLLAINRFQSMTERLQQQDIGGAALDAGLAAAGAYAAYNNKMIAAKIADGLKKAKAWEMFK